MPETQTGPSTNPDNTTVNEDLDLPSSKYGPDDDNQRDFTKGSGQIFPRLEFKTAAATLVKRKKFKENHFAKVIGKKDEDYIDLGESFDGFICGYRYKAIDFSVKGKVKISYDPKSPEFKAIKAEAEKKKPEGEKSSHMAGVEYLIYVEGHGYLTVLCSSASWKVCAGVMYGLRHKVVTFGSNLVEGNFVYQAPNVKAAPGAKVNFGDDLAGRKAVISAFVEVSGTTTVNEDLDAESDDAAAQEAALQAVEAVEAVEAAAAAEPAAKHRKR